MMFFARLAVSPDSRFVAFANTPNISIYDLQTKHWTQKPNVLVPSENSMSLAWMPDSKSLWTGGDKVLRWSTPDLKMLRALPVRGPVAVSGDGRTLATRSIPHPGETKPR